MMPYPACYASLRRPPLGACVAITLCLNAQQHKAPNIFSRLPMIVVAHRAVPLPDGEDAGIRSPRRERCDLISAFAPHHRARPSRAALLTGSLPNQIEEGRLHGFLPNDSRLHHLSKSRLYSRLPHPKMGPGRFEPGGRTRNPQGRVQRFRHVPRGRRLGSLRVLVWQSGSSSAVRRRIWGGIGHRPRVDSCSCVSA